MKYLRQHRKDKGQPNGIEVDDEDNKSLAFNQTELTVDLELEIIKGIAAGMLHITSEKIVHRDLAARNILVTGVMP